LKIFLFFLFSMVMLSLPPVIGRNIYPPEDNKKIANKLGTVVYQEYPSAWVPRRETIIVITRDGRYLVLTACMGEIENIVHLPGK